MGIIRGTLPQDNFTLISNDWLRDTQISYKEKGLLAAIASHREDYELTVEQLINQSKDGKDSVYSGLRGLVEAGYLVVERRRDERGRLGETDFVLTEPPKLPDVSKSGKARSGPDQGERSVSKSESSKSGEARSGEPSSGKPSSGESGTKKTTNLEDHSQEDDSVPPSEVRPPAADEAIQPTLNGEVVERSERDITNIAMGIARGWVAKWEERQPDGTQLKILMDRRKGSPQHAIASAIKFAVRENVSEVEIKRAMAWVNMDIPEASQLRRALVQVQLGWKPAKDWRPGQPHSNGLYVNGANGQRPRGGRGRSVVDVNEAWADEAPQYAKAAAATGGDW